MKVLLVNGSPHKEGCTYTALKEVEKELNAAGVETEIFWLGVKPISGCLGCAQCLKKGPNGEKPSLRCCIDDCVNEFLDKAEQADGFVFGSPVHYAALSGALSSFMDRAAFDQVNKYFTISSMPVVSSKYWNMVHGSTPEQVLQDEEGMQVMRELGRNMAWLLKCIEAGRAAGIPDPVKEKPVMTNFIR